MESGLESKQEIRRRLRALRQSLAPGEIEARSRQIENRVRALEDYAEAGALLVYLALPEEVQTGALIEEALRSGKRVYVPVVVPGASDLNLAEYTGPECLDQPGPFGLRQPRPGSGFPDRLDLVLTPGLAFDRAGRRLGFGKGYFDRLFARLSPECLRVGLAFEFQVIPRVPAGPGDRPVHRVVTEKETIVCAPSG